MVNKIIKTGFLLTLVTVFTLLHFQTVAASSLFYEGAVIVDSISTYIKIDNNKAEVMTEYVLINEGGKEESVDLGFSHSSARLLVDNNEIENPIAFEPEEEKVITLDYTADVGGETTKMLSFDPTLTFNCKANSQRVKIFFVEILLPEGIEKIIWSNKDYYDNGVDKDGRAFYLWVYDSVYPTTLSIKYSTLDINLGVVKEASPKKITTPNEKINISITIENKGDGVVNDIVLSDDFVPSDFEAVEPLEEFITTESNTSDPRLFWVKDIEQLKPGETKTASYSVKYIGDVSQIYDFDLKPSIITVNGNLVGVSNTVTLSKMAGVTSAEEADLRDEKGFPILYLVIGIVILIILSVFLLIMKKSKGKSI